jgi:hypothetical protein
LVVCAGNMAGEIRESTGTLLPDGIESRRVDKIAVILMVFPILVDLIEYV